jgi:hypothetical protein
MLQCFVLASFESSPANQSGGLIMKCLYYLSPTMDSTRAISTDLHSVGIKDWYIHVISKDEAGLKTRRIRSSNYIETMDLMRAGFIGAYTGFAVGVLGALLLIVIKPFGDVSGFPYIAFVIFATLFGAWEGGLYGVATENKKLAQFHDDIEGGKYLFLIYARKSELTAIQEMMSAKHPESEHVATDKHFVSSFSEVERERSITS